MTKKELIAALANVNDDAVVLFGTTGSTQNIYLFTLAVSAVLVMISNIILTNIHKNIKL